MGLFIKITNCVLGICNRVRSLYVLKVIKTRVNSIGENVHIRRYHAIYGKDLSIGNNVTIGDDCWLVAEPHTGEKTAVLIIGEGCNLGRFNEIYSTKEIILENNILTGERVYISDNLHDYSNPNIPIINQAIIQKKTVKIGEGSWIGVGAAIIGASIGKHCVIGANAVVTHDIPDFSVAVGIPAKVIKRIQ